MKATCGATRFPRSMGCYAHPSLRYPYGKSVGDCSLSKEPGEGLQTMPEMAESGAVLTACVDEHSRLVDADTGGDAVVPGTHDTVDL